MKATWNLTDVKFTKELMSDDGCVLRPQRKPQAKSRVQAELSW